MAEWFRGVCVEGLFAFDRSSCTSLQRSVVVGSGFLWNMTHSWAELASRWRSTVPPREGGYVHHCGVGPPPAHGTELLVVGMYFKM